jgi:HSP20 family protein
LIRVNASAADGGKLRPSCCVLTIKGEKKAEKEEKKKDFHLVERSYGSFARSLTLPFAADPSKAKATFKNGVLSISLPKPPEVKTKAKKIAIGSR